MPIKKREKKRYKREKIEEPIDIIEYIIILLKVFIFMILLIIIFKYLKNKNKDKFEKYLKEIIYKNNIYEKKNLTIEFIQNKLNEINEFNNNTINESYFSNISNISKEKLFPKYYRGLKFNLSKIKIGVIALLGVFYIWVFSLCFRPHVSQYYRDFYMTRKVHFS